MRQEPLYSDALAVARETMRRARNVIGELIQRLLGIGFVFGYDRHLMHFVQGIREGTMDWTDYLESLAWVQTAHSFIVRPQQLESVDCHYRSRVSS